MARGNITLWKLSESVFKLMAGVKPISSKPEMFLVADRRYLGRPFSVEGVEVKRFDRVIEIHINNELVMDVLREEDNILASSIKLLKMARKSLPVLADYIDEHTGNSVRVLYGITFINRGIERLGFSVLPIHNKLFQEVSRRHLRKLFQIVNPHADDLLEQHAEAYVPKVVAITRSTLLKKYGSA